MTRVRGRIDVLRTLSGELLRHGTVACRFQDLAIDTPRNRLVRAALDALARLVSDTVLANDCSRLAYDLGCQGVSGLKPSRAELSADQIGRHDADDLMMVTLARFAFDLVLPTEDEGVHSLSRFDRDERLVRHLFEKAVGNFLRLELKDWTVQTGRKLKWQVSVASPGAEAILPGMITDIVLEHRASPRRIVIDTKFTGIVTKSLYRDTVLRSGYVYQLYAYLRSQVPPHDPPSQQAEGILLHPALDADVDEHVVIQGHRMRFMTVDLRASVDHIAERLRQVVALDQSAHMLEV